MRTLYLVLMALLVCITPAKADYAVREGQAIIIYPGEPPAPVALPAPAAVRHTGAVQHHAPQYYLHSSHRQINGCHSCTRQNHHWNYVQVSFPHR